MNTEITNYITNNYYQLLKITKKITGNDELSRDLLHEVILQLYESKPIKLDEFTDEQIKYYIVKIIKINWISNTSKFFYKFKKEFLKYVEIDEFWEFPQPTTDYQRQILFDILEEEWAELDFFHKSLFELYLTLGSLKKVSHRTNIPLASVGRYIKEAKTEIKDKIIIRLQDIDERFD